MSEPTPPSLTTLAEIAFRRAAAKVILKARQTGTPIIVWEDGQIRYLSPDDFPDRDTERPTDQPASPDE